MTSIINITNNLSSIKSILRRFSNLLKRKRPNFPVNVMDWGAKCDGVTDDTEAILLALESARGVQQWQWKYTGYNKGTYSWHPLATIQLPGMCRTTETIPINYQRIAIVGSGIGRDSLGPSGILADHAGPAIELDLSPWEREKSKGWYPRKLVLDGLKISHVKKKYKGKYPEYELRIKAATDDMSIEKYLSEFKYEFDSKKTDKDWKDTSALIILVIIRLGGKNKDFERFDIAGIKKEGDTGPGSFKQTSRKYKNWHNDFVEQIPKKILLEKNKEKLHVESERRILQAATRLLGFDALSWPDGLSIKGERWWGDDRVYGKNKDTEEEDDIPAHWTRDILIRGCSFNNHHHAVSITYDQGSLCAFHAEHSGFGHNILGLYSSVKLTNSHLIACDITQNSFGGIRMTGSGVEIRSCDFEGQPRPIEIVGLSSAIHLGPNYFEANHSGDALVRLGNVDGFFVASPHISGCSIPSVYAENCRSGRIESPTPVLHNCSDVECTKPMSWAGYLGRSDPDKKIDYQSATIRPQSCSWNWAHGKPTKDYSHVTKRIIVPLLSPVGTQQNHSSKSESSGNEKEDINKAMKNWSNGADINILEGEQICAAISVKYMNTLATDPALKVQGIYIGTDGHLHWDDEITLFGTSTFPDIVQGDTVTYFGSFECKKKYVGLRICIYPYKNTTNDKEKNGYGARLSDAMVWLNPQLQKPVPPKTLESREKLWIPYTGEPH